MAASVEKKLLALPSWIISEAAVLRCFKIFEKIAKKTSLVEWRAFISKAKKKILPRMFSRKFSRIFQNSHFVEHFRLAGFLIR